MINLFCSLKKQKIPFEPIKNKEVRIYLCGPTVYDNAHLGHARSSIAFDLWRRLFLFLGYKVIFVKNFTDIDDKIIKKTLAQNTTLHTLTTHYINLYLKDMDALGVMRADIEPKATESITEISQMIDSLLQKGYAYKGSNNDVYLSTEKDKAYGSIAKRTADSLAYSRIESAKDKLQSHDFALWKGTKEQEEIAYESPFGRGRPGWHIECSAMIEKYLAYKDEDFAIDIHAGGADLLFPHHENEASQTRCVTGREIAKYWLHNGFVNINGKKMSKSLGNSFFIKDALKNYDGEILRNYLLGIHYRLDFNFSEEDLLQSKKRLDKLYRLKKRLNFSGDSDNSSQLGNLENLKIAKTQAQQDFIDSILQALSDDYNISKALSVLEDMLSQSNEYLDKNPKDQNYKRSIKANLVCVEFLLGLGGKNAQSYFQLGINPDQVAYIESQLAKRTEAKAQKNYTLADHLRNELKAQGIEIMDTPNGSTWEKI